MAGKISGRLGDLLKANVQSMAESRGRGSRNRACRVTQKSYVRAPVTFALQTVSDSWPQNMEQVKYCELLSLSQACLICNMAENVAAKGPRSIHSDSELGIHGPLPATPNFQSPSSTHLVTNPGTTRFHQSSCSGAMEAHRRDTHQRH